jgi:hypothetical protein
MGYAPERTVGTEICGYIAKLPQQDVPSVSKQESGPASGAGKLPGRILQTFTRGELYIERLHNVFSSRGDRDQVELLFARGFRPKKSGKVSRGHRAFLCDCVIFG